MLNHLCVWVCVFACMCVFIASVQLLSWPIRNVLSKPAGQSSLDSCLKSDSVGLVTTYLDLDHTPPWCWQSEVWSRSYVAPVVGGPRGWRSFGHLWHSRKRPSGSGCRGNVSSSSSQGQKPPALSPASFPDDHLEEQEVHNQIQTETHLYLHLNTFGQWDCPIRKTSLSLEKSSWLLNLILCFQHLGLVAQAKHQLTTKPILQ